MSKGFASILLIPILVLIALAGIFAYTKFKPATVPQPNIKDDTFIDSKNNSQTKTPVNECNWNGKNIQVPQGSAVGAFTSPVTDIKNISKVTNGSGTGDSRYTYLWINGNKEIPVYAPADGTLVKITYKTRTDLPQGMSEPDYDLAFLVDCHTLYEINHITSPAEKLSSQSPLTKPLEIKPGSGINDKDSEPKTNIQVKAGEQIGTTTGTPSAHNFDFGVFVDRSATCPYKMFDKNTSGSWVSLIPGQNCNVSGNF